MQTEHIECFSCQGVLVGVSAPDKYVLIDRLVTAIMQSDCMHCFPNLSTEDVASRVKSREDEQPTGMDHGVAFPHARLPGLQGVVLAVAILDKPVDFQSTDGLRAEFVCLLLVPIDRPNLALKAIAQLSAMFSSPVNRKYLRQEKYAQKIHAFILSELGREQKSLTAGELMRYPMADIFPETPIREVTRTMANLHLDSISVIDRDGTLLGEITCEHVAQLGMPEFFSKLKTVSFLSEFDPLERYFARERNMVASDVMLNTYAAVEHDATLLEVIFELAVKRHSKVYVLQDGKRVGVIDWNLMLNRVINI